MNINILVTGGAKVGKSSLVTTALSSMINTLKNAGRVSEIDDEVRRNVDKGINEIRSLFSTFEAATPSSLHEGINNVSSFSIELSTTAETSLNLQFDILDLDKVQNRKLEEADVIIVVIDSPALVEKPSRLLELRRDYYHKKINQPELLVSSLRDMHSESPGRKLFIFAPVKCEVYTDKNIMDARDVEDENEVLDARDLIDEVRRAYREVLDIVGGKVSSLQAASVIIPVETLGGIRFSRIEEKEEFYYSRKTYTSKYSPRYGIEIIKYIILFATKQKALQVSQGSLLELFLQRSENAPSEIIRGYYLLEEKDREKQPFSTKSFPFVEGFAFSLATILNIFIYQIATSFFDVFVQLEESRRTTGDTEIIIREYYSTVNSAQVILGTLLLCLGLWGVRYFLQQKTSLDRSFTLGISVVFTVTVLLATIWFLLAEISFSAKFTFTFMSLSAILTVSEILRRFENN